MDFSQIKLFSKKGGDLTFEDLIKQIYDNSEKNRAQITELLKSLKDLVDSPTSAQVIVPLIAQYLENNIKNDEALIKLATIIQRIMSKTQMGNSNQSLSDTIPEHELKDLWKVAEEIMEKDA